MPKHDDDRKPRDTTPAGGYWKVFIGCALDPILIGTKQARTVRTAIARAVGIRFGGSCYAKMRPDGSYRILQRRVGCDRAVFYRDDVSILVAPPKGFKQP